MADVEKNITDGNLTQKEIIQLLLHNAQHMATREEVKSDIKELREEVKSDIKELREEVKSDIKELREDLKQDISKVEYKITKVETTLKEDNKTLSNRIDRFMFWSLGLTITSTFLILGLIYKIVPK